MSYVKDAEAWYEKNVKEKGVRLASAHVAELKKELAKALRKGEQPRAVARRFLKEHGAELPAAKADAEEKKPAAKAKPQPPKTEDKPAPKPRTPEKVEPAPKMEVARVDRKALKATLEELKQAGLVVEYSKEDDDNTLRAKAHAALAKLAEPKAIKLLEKIDINKLTPITAGDCLGLFVDLRSAQCVACPDTQACVRKFVENMGNNFEVFKEALVDAQTEEAAAEVKEEDMPEKKPTKKTKDEEKPTKKPKEKEPEKEQEEPEKKPAKATGIKQKKIEYTPERVVVVIDQPNPNKKGHDDYQFIQDVLDTGTCRMSVLREISERYYEFPSDQNFVETVVHGLRSGGVIAWLEDLDRPTLIVLLKAIKEKGLKTGGWNKENTEDELRAKIQKAWPDVEAANPPEAEAEAE